MKSKKCKLSATIYCLAIITLALVLPNMAFALQSGDFSYTVSDNTVTITGYTGVGGKVVIPSAIEGMPVVGIGGYSVYDYRGHYYYYGAFQNCTSLTSVTIPNSVTSIGQAAFLSCSGLTSVTIPSGVTSIGSAAFSYCNGLTNVTIPNSVTSIGNYAFRECRGLTSVIIGNSVTIIGSEAFSYCTKLTSLTIGNSVAIILDCAFQYCYGLTSVTMPNSVKNIGHSAFQFCNGLTSVIIPSSVTIIGEQAFYPCDGLTSIVVDANNTTYSSQDGVLYNKDKTILIEYPCGKPGGFTIPTSVTSIGNWAFAECYGLTNVTIPDGVTEIGSSAFYLCTSLTSVTIPNSVTSLGWSVFQRCTGLTSVIIPDGVTRLWSWAFDECTGLTSVIIGSGVTSIEDWAFSGCTALTRAYLLGNAPSMGNFVFYYVDPNFTVCYTAGSTGFTTPTWNGYPAKVCAETICVAETIYGRDSEETELLREYRDKVLSKSATGRQMIKTYYELSPAVSEVLQKNDTARASARKALDTFLPAIREKVKQ